MDVDLVFKIAAIGILVAVLNILLSRAGRDEQAAVEQLAQCRPGKTRDEQHRGERFHRALTVDLVRQDTGHEVADDDRRAHRQLRLRAH